MTQNQKKTYSGYFLFVYFAVCLAVVLLDQGSKLLVVKYLKEIGDYPLIEGVFHFTYVENRGAAFGMLADNRWVFMIFSSVAVILIAVVLIIYRKSIKPMLGITLAAICGGGIGNMIDRVANGFVVDFLNFELIDFAVFNVADSFITVGAILMIICVLFDEISERKKAV